MLIKQDEYGCENCGEVWGFFPEDYDNPKDYPTRCPMCSMPFVQMVKDLFDHEGLGAVLEMIWLRYFTRPGKKIKFYRI